jgi:hypothetical protein
VTAFIWEALMVVAFLVEEIFSVNIFKKRIIDYLAKNEDW